MKLLPVEWREGVLVNSKGEEVVIVDFSGWNKKDQDKRIKEKEEELGMLEAAERINPL